MSSSAPESSSAKKRKIEDDDAITILEKVIEFQTRTGTNPTPTNMRPLFESLKDDLRVELSGPEQLYNRIRIFRQRYHRAQEAGGLSAVTSSYEKMFFELSVAAWGEDYRRKPAAVIGGPARKLKVPRLAMAVKIEEEELEEENHVHDNGVEDDVPVADEVTAEGDDDEVADGEPSKLFYQQAMDYWRMAGLPDENLEMGMKAIDPGRMRALENRWGQHVEATLKQHAKECELNKDLNAALLAVVQKHKDLFRK